MSNKFKMILGAFAITMASSTAMAASNRVILQMTTSGGMMAPNRANTSRTYVLENGDVMQTQRSAIAILPDQLQGTLSREVMDHLLNIAERAKAGKLVDDNEGAPRCMDAPTTTYEIFNKNGFAFKFKARVGCHDLELRNGSVDVYVLSSILEGLRSLNNLK